MSFQSRSAILDEIGAELGAGVLSYVTGDRENLETEVGTDVLERVPRHLEAIGKQDRLALVLYTLGGDTNTPWPFVNFLRAYCDELFVLVPFWALLSASRRAASGGPGGSPADVLRRVEGRSRIAREVRAGRNAPAAAPAIAASRRASGGPGAVLHRDLDDVRFVRDARSDLAKTSDAAVASRRVVSADHPRMVATTAAVAERLSAGDGLLYRYLHDESPDGIAGDEGAFVLCSFWLGGNLAQGRVEEASELYASLCARSSTLGLLPEQIDPSSDEFCGNFPQAFSHIGVIAAGVTLARVARGQ
jgi:hypothetical protein